jgi:hypothetical protein
MSANNWRIAEQDFTARDISSPLDNRRIFMEGPVMLTAQTWGEECHTFNGKVPSCQQHSEHL